MEDFINSAKYELDSISELVIFFGDCGAGKSSLMVHFVDDYLKTQGDKRRELSEQITNEENKTRKKQLSFPKVPPVCSNLKNLNLKLRNGEAFKPIYIKGKEVGISNDKKTYKSLRPASLVVIDEAHDEFSSKGSELEKGQRDLFNKRRHDRLIILLAAPRGNSVHKDIRNTGARFIEVLGQTHERDVFGRIYKTTWRCHEFSDKKALEEYLSTDGASGAYANKTYVHDGNIYDLYDSFAFVKEFLPPEGKDFED